MFFKSFEADLCAESEVPDIVLTPATPPMNNPCDDSAPQSPDYLAVPAPSLCKAKASISVNTPPPDTIVHRVILPRPTILPAGPWLSDGRHDCPSASASEPCSLSSSQSAASISTEPTSLGTLNSVGSWPWQAYSNGSESRSFRSHVLPYPSFFSFHEVLGFWKSYSTVCIRLETFKVMLYSIRVSFLFQQPPSF